MPKKTLSTAALILETLCILLAVVLFVFLDDLERWYSGVFFAIMGAVFIANGMRWQSETEE